MKDSNEFFANLGLSAEGRAYVESVLGSPPSRVVSSYRGSNIGKFASIARSRSLQSEARHTEFAYLHMLEFDRSVVDVADQPEPLQVYRPPGTLTPVGGPRRADFLVVRQTCVELIECKLTSELEALQRKRPEWYFLDSQGYWHFLPMEIAARSLGIRYSIVTDREINGTLCRNVSFLWPYYRSSPKEIDNELFKIIASKLATSTISSFEELATAIGDRYEVIYLMIAHGYAFVDLPNVDLTNGTEVLVYQNRKIFETALTVNRALENGVERPNAPSIFKGLSSHDLQETVKRYRRIEPYLLRNISPPKKLHFEYRYYRRFKRAERDGKPGIEGILSRTSKRGWRGPRLPKHVIEALKDAFELDWESPVAITKTAFFGKVGRKFAKLGFQLPSRKTINAYLARFHRDTTDRRRQGRYGEYKQRGFSTNDQPLELHGTRLLEIVHIDHKLLRVLIRCSRTGQLLGLCWLTLAIDAFTRMPVGFWLDFARPNAVSLLMVLRDIVWRFGRLPTTIVADNGAEFHSALYQLLIAKHGSHALYRAPGHSSDGGIVERGFLTIDTDVIQPLEGVISKDYKDLKKYDPFTDPRARARHTINDIYARLEQYLFHEYPNFQHSELGASPQMLWDISKEETGLFSLPSIDREEFYFDSLPFDPRKQTRRINRSSGISIRKRNYWNPAFRNPELHGRDVNVRFDPVNPFFVYAQIGSDWLRCDVFQASRLQRLTQGSQYRNIEWRRRTALVEQARDNRAIEVAAMHERFELPEPNPTLPENQDAHNPDHSEKKPKKTNSFKGIDFSNLEANPTWKIPR